MGQFIKNRQHYMGVRKWGQPTPWKMDEKLNSENMQKTAFFGMGAG